MTMSDPIADMLTRIRNANTAKHDTVDIPSSKMKIASCSTRDTSGSMRWSTTATSRISASP